MTTTHQYLDKYPISAESEKLIVGTIHPHDHENFKIPFFYGNKTSLWTILSEAFPEDLKQPIALDNVLAFLNTRKIAMSDTIRKCDRKKNSAQDQDLIPLELNTQILTEIRNSNINEIFFTSGFSKNNAFKLFFIDILGYKKIPDEVRKDKEIIIEKEFGRPVRLTILHSPSGSSNIGLSKNPDYISNKHKYVKSSRPIFDFKVDYYRNKFK